MCHVFNGISQCYPIFTADTFSELRFSTIKYVSRAHIFSSLKGFYFVDVSLSKGICLQEAVI